ncbi:MAG: 3-deoxy-D-manno-octulosonic acid transferase, partial [Candidatus Omnitrophica bacterium]|nr:3-deoxy-D-manno-octulosonic acid transferase [Candidatus Omnitrophota bacterium]
LGAVPEKVCIVGNLKFDNIPAATEMQKASLGFQENEDLLIAGSTHPGEEDILIDAYRELVAEFPDLRLVLAPRHIERADAVIDLVEKQGYRPVRFSQVGEHKSDARSVVVVDTIGHLRDLYSLASVVFVGKSLAVGGGQNMIEPASLGKPTLVGPMTQNFKDAVNIFLQSGALVEVRDSQELLTEARRLLSDPQSAKEIGEAARGVVEQYQGATAKTLDAIRERLA